jgi:ParB family chromosome partitioning protein
MNITELSVNQLKEAAWNSNQIDEVMLQRLRSSVKRFGFLGVLVVRPIGENFYEVLSGNQRLKVVKEMQLPVAPCIVVEADDAHARLLAQALNHIHGEDDLGLKAETVQKILESIAPEDVLSILPETANGLRALAELGHQPVAEYLRNWEQAKQTRLRHLQFQLTVSQLEVVEQALKKLLPEAKIGQFGNPNTRGSALYLLCKAFIDREA